jgi:hypothetical protein
MKKERLLNRYYFLLFSGCESSDRNLINEFLEDYFDIYMYGIFNKNYIILCTNDTKVIKKICHVYKPSKIYELNREPNKLLNIIFSDMNEIQFYDFYQMLDCCYGLFDKNMINIMLEHKSFYESPMVQYGIQQSINNLNL